MPVFVLTFFVCFSQTNSDERAFLRNMSLRCDSSGQSILQKAGYSQNSIRNLSLYDYEELSQKVISYLENRGYPFADVSIQTSWTNDTIPVYNLVVNKNRFVTVDSMVVKGSSKIRQSFLCPYLGIRRKSAYNERVVSRISRRLNALPFVAEAQPSGLSFENDKTVLYLYLDKRKTNRFDGYIGFQPVSTLSGRLSVTGELSLDLQNLFNVGESFSARWYSSERYSQFLSLNVDFPYLFYTRFGVDANFSLDKHDTSYLNLDYGFGIPYHFFEDCSLRPFFKYSKSQTLGNKEDIVSSMYVGFRTLRYGLTLNVSYLDYKYNPRKGFEVMLEASAGNRVIDADANVGDVRGTNYQLRSRVVGYIPVYKMFTVVLRAQAGTIGGGKSYQNEMYRIGGEQLIRGFSQNELLATTYLLYSAELRYLFGRNSDFHLFFDGGSYERFAHGGYLQDSPFGFGLGVNVGVRSGIFYFEYALPRQRGNHLSLKTGKVHFGVKALF